MKLFIAALCLSACVVLAGGSPASTIDLNLLGSVTDLVGGVLDTLTGKGGLLDIALEGLKGLDLIKGLLGTVLTLIASLPATLLSLLPLPAIKLPDGSTVTVPGGLPIDITKLPIGLDALALLCPLLGALGAVLAVVAAVAGIAVGVVGAVLTVAANLTAGLPLLGATLAGLPGLVGANVVQLLNLNVILNALCAAAAP